MLRKMILLPATLATALVIGGCEEGDFDDDLGEPDIQTETEMTDPDAGAVPPADPPELEQESDLQLDQPADEGGQFDTSTSDPVDVQQDVDIPEEQGQAEQQQPEQAEQAADDADAVEEVPAESLPGDNQSGNEDSGNENSGDDQ